ncbi:MAG TPA: hypothetical protein VKU37_08400 [Verrucomicrobiae bacterium]|nr:hypothetical protein [Verrucomicrobiae bacterium]
MLIIAASGWMLWKWFSVSPAARTAKPYARKFAKQIKSNPRFAGIRVGVLKFGNKGPIYVRGTVASDADRTDLRRQFETLRCPVGSDWDVFVHIDPFGATRTN